MKDLHTLPDDLPCPVDDGACDHLHGARLPAIALRGVSGRTFRLDALGGILVLYFYPMNGRPDGPPMPGWNAIPGARGCTPQACAFRDRNAELRALGATIFGVSAQPPEDQREAHARLHLPFELLNDSDLRLARATRLPTFEYASRTLIKRVTLIAEDGVVRKVFYPVFPPDLNADEVLEWLREFSKFKD